MRVFVVKPLPVVCPPVTVPGAKGLLISRFTPYKRCSVVSTGEAPLLKANVYPNPAQDWVTLQVTAPITFEALTLYDALGRPVRIFPNLAAVASVELSLIKIPKGIYYLQGITEKGELLRAEIVRQ